MLDLYDSVSIIIIIIRRRIFGSLCSNIKHQKQKKKIPELGSCITLLIRLDKLFRSPGITGWERTGQMLCIVDTSLSVLMTLKMCLRELCCLFTVWI